VKYGHPAGYQDTTQGKETIKRLRKEFIAGRFHQVLKSYTEFLEASKGDFILGDDLTIADLYIFAQLKEFAAGNIEHVPATCMASFPQVNSYLKRIANVPAIKEWYSKKH
jgi:glutathione S-transferase